tara:strand:+ start:908 stop:1051 length:144 start_codon:yes stop_codon:yes gene_type:complete
MEEEWYSLCCGAPPLYGLHEEEGVDTIGICMSCRENTSFKLEEDSNE